jgi:STE24 endopeptidase
MEAQGFDTMELFAALIALLIAFKVLAQLWLQYLNRQEVLRHAGAVPESFQGAMDEATYHKATEYTLAKGRFSRWELALSTVVLLVALYSGVLPAIYRQFTASLGNSAWSMAAYLFAIGLLMAIPDLPLSWLEQFRLEQRFGFNTTTQKTWWLDHLKGLLLALLLGYPLLVLVIKIVEWTGNSWWLWAWGVIIAFQLLMLVLAPILILPLFNKFTPLPEGSLRQRLLALGERTGFHSKTIQVMDGSKRSRHSNAFFTGFGRFRKIILFDTLIQQLGETELEAVLAHEIGHYKKRHIPKMLAGSAFGLLITFFVIARLAREDWFYHAFGFAVGSIVPALLLFSLLSGLFTFWFSPVINSISRRFEYQADAYAALTMKEAASLTGALRKLNEKNLSNLTPHPLYSAFYYSHPTLIERERALAKI